MQSSLNNSTKTAIQSNFIKFKTQIYNLRRKIHQNPELGWHEIQTTDSLCEVLDEYNILYKRFHPTGLMVDIYGNSKDKKLIALRADLDALAIKESKNMPYSSKVVGFMHACGHDFHTAALLGAVLITNSLKSKLNKNIRFIWQPSEEKEPSGALGVIKQGALKNVEQLYALHCDPSLEVGTLGIRSGAITSAASGVDVTLFGKGGHTSRPHLTSDIVYALSSLVVESAGYLSRRLDPRTVTSLIWGSLQAGEAPNSVASQGQLAGSFRTMSLEIWQKAEVILTKMISDILQPYDFNLQINVAKGIAPVVNSENATNIARFVAGRLFGENKIKSVARSLGAEDFAWLLLNNKSDGLKSDGALIRLGVRGHNSSEFDLHTKSFQADEKCLDTACPYLAALALF
ncbi:MAG: amidohydrolase [Bifidobacteriaceae bacterium]|jgi:amidohydrolase|nr:amidohydrolase [Bifidobacteriaceae bacterium]